MAWNNSICWKPKFDILLSFPKCNCFNVAFEDTNNKVQIITENNSNLVECHSNITRSNGSVSILWSYCRTIHNSLSKIFPMCKARFQNIIMFDVVIVVIALFYPFNCPLLLFVIIYRAHGQNKMKNTKEERS